jgi:hypothetical protein
VSMRGIDFERRAKNKRVRGLKTISDEAGLLLGFSGESG